MAEQTRKPLRQIARPFVTDGPTGVSIRDRLKSLTGEDEKVLRAVGEHMGRLASADLTRRCRDGLDHSTGTWAARKRDLTALSSSRWAGSITSHTHDQWGLSRRAQHAHLKSLDAGIRTIRHRLSLPVGEKGSRGTPGGYRSKHEWFHKSRRLAVLEERYERVRAEREAGQVSVVRGGRRLLKQRHNLTAAEKTPEQWRSEWEAARWFLTADGESGKRHGNETIRVTPDGEVSINLPAPLAGMANAKHGRYVLAARVTFPHRGDQWRDRVTCNRAVAYRIHHDTASGRWYLDASWTRKGLPVIGLGALRSGGVIGVDTNADHLAAWLLDEHGNPVGSPRRFDYDLTGTAPPPRRPAPPRPHPPPALGPGHRRTGHRDRRPRLHRLHNQGEARPEEEVPAARLRHPHRQTPRPAPVDVRRGRYQRDRRRSRLHVHVGRTALAEAADRQKREDLPTRCRLGGHR